MVKGIRLEENIYYFLKEHSDLKLEISPWGIVTNVIFPENCSTATSIILHGKIEYIQYSTFDSSELFTYNSGKDPAYYEGIMQWMEEVSYA